MQMRIAKVIIGAFLGLVLGACSASGEVVEGLVVGVHDGDTIKVLSKKTEYQVRLARIDAPELKQPFGKQSKQ